MYKLLFVTLVVLSASINTRKISGILNQANSNTAAESTIAAVDLVGGNNASGNHSFVFSFSHTKTITDFRYYITCS